VIARLECGRGHGGTGLPWRTLLLSGMALALYVIFGAAPEAWVYDRGAIGQGEWWRLVSGHWVHGDPGHALWDITGLLVLGAVFEPRLKSDLGIVLLLSSLGIAAWLWFAEPALAYYCGLSGILNGLLALGLVHWWYEERHPLIWLTGLGAIGKILWESLADEALLTSTLWPSVPEVHGVGFLCGLLLGLMLYRPGVYGSGRGHALRDSQVDYSRAGPIG